MRERRDRGDRPVRPRLCLVVNFQEVVHSALAVNAEVAKPSDSRSTEWTLTRMPF